MLVGICYTKDSPNGIAACDAFYKGVQAVGDSAIKILAPKGRRLNSKLHRICNRYIQELERLFCYHRIYNKLVEISKNASFLASAEAKEVLEKMDKLMTALIQQSERQCRKLHKGDHEYSPEVSEWLDSCHAYKALLRQSRTKRGKRSQALWFAKRCGIVNAHTKTTKALAFEYKTCRE